MSRRGQNALFINDGLLGSIPDRFIVFYQAADSILDGIVINSNGDFDLY
jgi:hypothetical protein